MEYKTCEMYVLGELEAVRRENEALREEVRTKDEQLNVVREVFFMVGEGAADGAKNPTIRLGVHDERLKLGEDPGALGRLMRLRNIFGGDPFVNELIAGVVRKCLGGDQGAGAGADAAELEAVPETESAAESAAD